MVPYNTRLASYESMVKTLRDTTEKEQTYRNFLENANQNLKDLDKYCSEHIEVFKKFEAQRAEQMHSSINQFVVFEKFAEMNNKYDAKNFGDLIDSFSVEKEMQSIQKIIEQLEDGVP